MLSEVLFAGNQWSAPVELYTFDHDIKTIELEVDSNDQLSFVFLGSTFDWEPGETRADADLIYYATESNGLWLNPEIISREDSYSDLCGPIYRLDDKGDRHVIWGNNREVRQAFSCYEIKYVTLQGQGWSVPETIWRDPPQDGIGFLSFTTGLDGVQAILTNGVGRHRVLIAERDSTGWNDVYHPLSSWSNSDEAWQMDAALDYGHDNSLHLVFVGESPTDSLFLGVDRPYIYYAEKGVDGPWTEPVKVDPERYTVPAKVQIIVDGRGVRHLLWFGIGEGSLFPEGIYYASSPDGLNWSEPIGLIHVDPAREIMVDSFFTVDKTATVHFLRRRISRSGGSIIEYTTISAAGRGPTHTVMEYTTPDTTSAVGFDLAVDSKGRVHFVWMDNVNRSDEPKYRIMYRYLGEPKPRREIREFIEVEMRPNPFVQSATIRVSPRYTSTLSANVYNLRGQLVRTLVENRQIQGTIMLSWDGRDNAGARVASGVYIYHVDGVTLDGENVTYAAKLIYLH